MSVFASPIALFVLTVLPAVVVGFLVYLNSQRRLHRAQQIINTQGQQLALAEQQQQHDSNIHQEKIQALTEAKATLESQFRALSDEALQRNTEKFLQLAQQKLTQQQEQQQQKAAHDLEKRQQINKEAIGQMLNPMRETLQRLESSAKQAGEKQAETHGQLAQQVKHLNALQYKVQEETGKLVSALRRPETRGRWGEITLRRVLEESGMMPNCVFSEQETVTREGAALRPDVILNLPGDRKVVIDAKTSLDAYINVAQAETEQERREQTTRHARQIKTHLQQLGKKAYFEEWDSPEFVIMFVPVESALGMALEEEPGLLEQGWRDRVVLATPTTLMATVMAISWSWKEKAIQEEMQHTIAIGKEMYERLCVFAGHLERSGKQLNSAVDNFNKAASSFETRLLPGARKFSELSGKALPVLSQSDHLAKTQLNVPEVVPALNKIEAVDAGAGSTVENAVVEDADDEKVLVSA